jgi:malonyl-CoA O-methyltransferase
MLKEIELEKTVIADSFSRAAESYDSAAWYQRRVGEQLLSKVKEYVAPSASKVQCLDVGAGTGLFTRLLASLPWVDQTMGLDMAEGMVLHARKQASTTKDMTWLVGDAESLPLKDGSIDLIFSNMAIQWVRHPQRLFKEWARVLKPQGYAAFTTLLPATLHELTTCWQKVDDYQHVNQFTPLPEMKQSINESGLKIELFERKIDILQYQDVKSLLKELKAVGAHNINVKRPKTMMGKTHWQQFQRAYEDLKTPQGALPATWHMLYGVLKHD